MLPARQRASSTFLPVNLREPNTLQLVAQLLGTAGTGKDSYGQGNQGGYGQDSNTGEQRAIQSGLLLLKL